MADTAQDFNLSGEWAGSPARLSDDSWGAWVRYTDKPPQVGEKVIITTKGGRRYDEWITAVERADVAIHGRKLALCRTSRKRPPQTPAQAADAALRREDAALCPTCGQPLPAGARARSQPAADAFEPDQPAADADPYDRDGAGGELTLDDIPFALLLAVVLC